MRCDAAVTSIDTLTARAGPMGGHTTDGPRDGCPTEVELGFLRRVKPFADQPTPTDGRIPAGSAESGVERAAGRDRDRLQGTLDDVD
jgi:hypothetical protein